jgi:hypothetical protein
VRENQNQKPKIPFGSLIFNHSSKIAKLPSAAVLAILKDRTQLVRSIQPSKKLSRTNVVTTKPSLSKKKAYNMSDKRTRTIFTQFMSPVSCAISSVLRRPSARTMNDKTTRINPDQKKIKPEPGSVTLPKPSRVFTESTPQSQFTEQRSSENNDRKQNKGGGYGPLDENQKASIG